MNILFFLLQIQYGLCFFTPFLRINKYELSMETTPVLYNAMYGGFIFSKKFEDEFEKEYNVSVPVHDAWFPNNVYNNSGIDARYDSRVLNIYKKLGASSSSSQCSYIENIEIPNDLLDYIHISEYDGIESLIINISKKYKDLLLEAINNPNKMVSNDDFLEILNMKMYEKYLDDNSINYL